MRERNHAFDILCGICIIRMVSLHIMAFCGQEDQEWWGEVMRWSFFFMSFFCRNFLFRFSIFTSYTSNYVISKSIICITQYIQSL